MPKPQQICGNCRFLDDTYQDGTPRCHRYPPLDKEKMHQNSGNLLFFWFFPEVDREKDWCGEWRPILASGNISAYEDE